MELYCQLKLELEESVRLELLLQNNVSWRPLQYNENNLNNH